MTIERLSGDAGVAEIITAIERDGAAIVEDIVSTDVTDQVLHDLREPFDTVGRTTESDFNDYTTLRVNSILDISRASVDLVAHDRVLEILDGLLLPHCKDYRIGSCTAIEIHPGETDQLLHRDDTIYPIVLPGLETQVSVMWPLTDFTDENGATHLIPGSHRWMEERFAKDDDPVIQAPMSPGSALFYLGSTMHGGGANRGNAPRTGLVNTYALGWLRQEENQYLAVPPHIAKDLREDVQHLIGYKLHGTFLGWVEGQDPHVVLEDRFSDVMPATPEGGEANEETKILKTATIGKPEFITFG